MDVKEELTVKGKNQYLEARWSVGGGCLLFRTHEIFLAMDWDQSPEIRSTYSYSSPPNPPKLEKEMAREDTAEFGAVRPFFLFGVEWPHLSGWSLESSSGEPQVLVPTQSFKLNEEERPRQPQWLLLSP